MDRQALIDEFKRAHHAHTILLYGSRARGDATLESDIDIAAFADVPGTYRDARLWNGFFLDGFVYPTAIAQSEVDDEMCKLSGALALLDERGLAAPFLRRVEARETEPLPPLPETERRMRRVWAQKMLARIRRGDVEANYRYHWLLFQLLEDHYPMIGKRYPGPKRALLELSAHDPATFAAFESTLVPGAHLEKAEALVEHLGRLYDGTVI